jgi:hypothetical protein
MEQLEGGIVQPQYDPCVAETFSLGLTLLDAALMQDSSSLYNIRSPSFRKGLFRDMVIRWRNSGYSPFLVHTVENMLEV